MGEVSVIALIERKANVSRSLFSRYWRDVHGVMAARIPGFDTYTQFHMTPINNANEPIIEPFEGIAVVTFKSAAAREALATSPLTAHIFRDEQNAFRRALLYSLADGAVDIEEFTKGETQATVFFVIPQGHDALKCRRVLKEAGPLAMRVFDLSSGDPSLWNSTDPDDGGKGRRFTHIIETRWRLPEQGSMAAERVRAEVSPKIGRYFVDGRYVMVDNGMPTQIGLRGLDAALTVQEAEAVNQIDPIVVREVYGSMGR